MGGKSKKRGIYYTHTHTHICLYTHKIGSDNKESAYNMEDLGSIPGSGGSFGEGNGNPLQYLCLENFMDRGAWRATVHRIAKSQT